MKLLLILVAATLSAQTPLPGPILGGTTGPQGPAGPAPSGTGAVQVTSGVAGLVTGTSSNCVLVNGTSAPCDAPGQGVVSNVTPVTVSANVTSAQVLQQLSLTAGLLNVAGNSGGVYTYNGSGIYTAAALQTPTLTWTLNLCTVSGCGSGTVRALATIVTPAVVTATNNAWNIRLHIGNTATGATGTLITHGSAIVELTAASDLGTASSDSNTASSGTIDLTAALFLQLTVTTSTGSAGNSITEDHSSLEPASAIGPTGPTGPVGGSFMTDFCVGVAGSSGTFSIPGMGTNAGQQTCNQGYQTNTGVVMPSAGTATALYVNAALAGVNSSSGVFTVQLNDSAQTMTCTVGTGTACNDTVHPFTFTAGQRIGMKFTTQGTESLCCISVSIRTAIN